MPIPFSPAQQRKAATSAEAAKSAEAATSAEADKARDELVALVPVPRQARWTWKRLAFLIVSLVLIAGGFALVPVPVASGLPLWIPGILMLGLAVPPVARWINRLESRLPDRWRRRLRPRLWWRTRRKLKQLAR
jgi:hypothetical protein